MFQFFIVVHLNAQNAHELKCPCTLEYGFPKSIQENQLGILTSFGGVPILKLEKAKIRNNKLICIYSNSFMEGAPTGMYGKKGFGFSFDRDRKEVPLHLTFTLKKDELEEWYISRETVRSKSYYRGCVVYTLDRCDDVNKYSMPGAFYKLSYEGKPIELHRKFEGFAILNKYANGIWYSKNKDDLTTMEVNNTIDLNKR